MNTLLKILIIFCAIMAIWGVVIGTQQSSLPPQERAAREAARAEAKERELAFYAAESFVGDRLKAPRSARFSSYPSESAVGFDKDQNTYVVQGYVDAQNSFGAMIRTRYQCWLARNQQRDKWVLYRIVY